MADEQAPSGLAARIDRFLTEASWMTHEEIAGKARLLLREALDLLATQQKAKSTKASDVLGWMDSESPVTRASGKPT